MNLAPKILSTLEREKLSVPGRPHFNPVVDRPSDPQVPRDVLAAANQSFDSRFIFEGIFITERNPVNWVPVPPGFDRALPTKELDQVVVPWNAKVQAEKLFGRLGI